MARKGQASSKSVGSRHVPMRNGRSPRVELRLVRGAESRANVPVATDVNLFAGAGGLAVGARRAGLLPTLLYENNVDAWQTLLHNRVVTSTPPEWSSHKGDVTQVDWSSIESPTRLLLAGVPCQPFSLGGKHKADTDGRNLFPELARAVRTLRPAAVLAENVHGLLRDGFRPYFDYIVRTLTSPSVGPKSSESWRDHDRRLLRHQRKEAATEYLVSWAVLNAADYGVPQVRRRVFIVATRSDVGAFKFPEPTHSRQALVRAQLDGSYWKRRDLCKPRDLAERLGNMPEEDGLTPWVTVRDALGVLTRAARCERKSKANHWLIFGARAYPGHDGSSLDWASKTIKAGVHGVAGGENTVVNERGGIRYYTLREAATIQTFSLDYYFVGARSQVTRQIGNAVPPLLALSVIRPLRQLLLAVQPKSSLVRNVAAG